MDRAYWIQGPAQSGKTARLIQQFQTWQREASSGPPHSARSARSELSSAPQPALASLQQGPRLLLFAATGDNRIELVNRLTEATGGSAPIQSTTPLAFFESEVSLFWPLLIQKLDLKPRFPLRLRPETEQELATQLWKEQLQDGPLQQDGISRWRLVRRILDLYLLAASAGLPAQRIGDALQDGMPDALGKPELWKSMGEALLRWRGWCLERGLLTYGLLSELYARVLLPDPTYQARLRGRYDGVLADDVDEYPAIAYPLFEQFLSQDALTLFTYNPQGSVRLGFGADPEVLAQLKPSCRVEYLPSPRDRLAASFALPVVQLVRDAGLGGGALTPLATHERINPFFSLNTMARSQLLREVAEEIIRAVQAGEVQPHEIAVVGPGVDAIARYTLMEILGKQNIRLKPLTEQRPLHSSPMVRSLLTLLAFVYPGLGRLLDPDQVAEMLVVLSLKANLKANRSSSRETDLEMGTIEARPRIDPVRAGLLADHCYQPDPSEPQLLSIESFPRWDRLGYEASQAYGQLLDWLETQRLQRSQRLIASPLVVLDRAIQTFLWNGSALAYDQLAALRELLEAAQHYWEVDARLTPEDLEQPAVARFIRLLRGGTITANPYPVQPLGEQAEAIALATLFQYRINRASHRWQFWLDAGSPLWASSAGELFGAPIFLSSWPGRPITLVETDRKSVV